MYTSLDDTKGAHMKEDLWTSIRSDILKTAKHYLINGLIECAKFVVIFVQY